jgi:hypothetical protein
MPPTGPAGLRSGYLGISCGLLFAVAIACATNRALNLGAALRSGRPACLALNWAAVRPQVLAEPVPDTLLLLPADTEGVGGWTWPRPSGPVGFLDHQSVANAELWMWSLAGDTVAIRTLTPTEQDLVIVIRPDWPDSANWWLNDTGPNRGAVRVAVCRRASPRAAT